MRIPKRHDERVSGFPIKPLVTDVARPAATKGVVDDRAGMAMRLGFLARSQKLKSALDGRHRGPACHGLAKFQNVSVKSIRSSCFNQGSQVSLGIGPLVVKEICCWGAAGSSRDIERGHLVAGFLDRLRVLGVWLKKKLLQRLDQWDIEPIEPNDRFS